MKTRQTVPCEGWNDGETGPTQALLRTCPKVVDEIGKARETLLAEFRALLNAPERTLRLALNEAEALAWQTPYPHLLFPTLAEEKIQDAEAWHRRQAAIAAIALGEPPVPSGTHANPRALEVFFSGLPGPLGPRHAETEASDYESPEPCTT